LYKIQILMCVNVRAAMYKAFFGLKELPFRNNLDSTFFYEKASRLEILQALIYVINRGDAIIKVTGEVGSGKTTLLRLVAQELNDRLKLVYINSPNLSPKDLLLNIAEELSIKYPAEVNKLQLLQLIRIDLLSRYAEGEKVVVLVDEAQSIGVDTLEELRLLTNIETDKDKLIQLVLFGQPELDVAINNNALRQLKSRITYSIHIPALTVSDVYDYLNHRMRIASYRGLDFFNYSNSKKIHKLSQGLPRTINSIADQLLMSSYGFGDTKLKSNHFKNLNSLELYTPASRYNYVFFSAILLFILMFSIAGYIIYSQNQYSDSPIIVSETVHQEEKSISDYSIKLEERIENDINIEPKLDLQPSITPVLINETPPPVVLDQQSNSVQMSTQNVDTNQVEYISKMKRLIALHSDTVNWLANFKKSDYIIQLSTSSVDKFEQNIESYKQYKNIMTNLHFMLALNQEGTVMRIKTLYLGSDSYAYLRNELSVLPEPIKKARPFIVNASTLKESAQSNSLKLKVMEIHE